VLQVALTNWIIFRLTLPLSNVLLMMEHQVIKQKKASLIVITDAMVEEILSLQLYKLLQLVSVGSYHEPQ